MRIKIYPETKKDYVILNVSGDLATDPRATNSIRAAIDEQISSERYNIALNLENAGTIDSSLVGMINKEVKALRSKGGSMAVIRPANNPYDIFAKVRIEKILPRYETKALFERTLC
jgi:anti-anti-sigma factor